LLKGKATTWLSGRTSTLPDFYIGAHAAVSGLVLLTRDAARYRTYFPKLAIIAPERP
jgi:predicted nucleic acid-binding protein